MPVGSTQPQQRAVVAGTWPTIIARIVANSICHKSDASSNTACRHCNFVIIIQIMFCNDFVDFNVVPELISCAKGTQSQHELCNILRMSIKSQCFCYCQISDYEYDIRLSFT